MATWPSKRPGRRERAVQALRVAAALIKVDGWTPVPHGGPTGFEWTVPDALQWAIFGKSGLMPRDVESYALRALVKMIDLGYEFRSLDHLRDVVQRWGEVAKGATEVVYLLELAADRLERYGLKDMNRVNL